MAKFVFKLKRGAVPKLLKGQPVQSLIEKEAQKATAGMDVLVSKPFVGANRARVTIFPESKHGEEQLRGRFGK